jgi:hypothetical protein
MCVLANSKTPRTGSKASADERKYRGGHGTGGARKRISSAQKVTLDWLRLLMRFMREQSLSSARRMWGVDAEGRSLEQYIVYICEEIPLPVAGRTSVGFR